jgi:hypothetical protein
MRDHETSDNKRQAGGRARLRRAGPAAAALACLILLAACSAGSSDPASDTGAGSPGGSAHSMALAYSECMRSHGIKSFPDPNSQGGISLNAGPGTGIYPNSPQFKAAQQTCRKLMPANKLSPAQQAANEARALRYSECMRSHGIADFPDPNSQGGIAIRSTPGSDLDPHNPRYQAANSACQHLMPGGGKGGTLTTGGGPNGSGSGGGS